MKKFSENFERGKEIFSKRIFHANWMERERNEWKISWKKIRKNWNNYVRFQWKRIMEKTWFRGKLNMTKTHNWLVRLYLWKKNRLNIKDFFRKWFFFFHYKNLYIRQELFFNNFSLHSWNWKLFTYILHFIYYIAYETTVQIEHKQAQAFLGNFICTHKKPSANIDLDWNYIIIPKKPDFPKTVHHNTKLKKAYQKSMQTMHSCGYQVDRESWLWLQIRQWTGPNLETVLKFRTKTRRDVY